MNPEARPRASIHRRLTSPFKKFGFWAGLAYIMQRSLAALPGTMRLHLYDFMVQPITDKELLPGRLARRLEVREVRRGDPELHLMPPPDEVKEARFEQGAICLAAFVEDRMAAYIWLCTERYDEDEIRCTYLLRPVDESVFDFDVYVFPEQRLGLAFVGLWNGANRFLFDRGIRHSFSRLNRFNVASKRSHDRLGWRRVGRALVLAAGRFQVILSDARPYVSVSIVRRPELVLEV